MAATIHAARLVHAMATINQQPILKLVSDELKLQRVCSRDTLIPLPVQAVVPADTEDFDRFMTSTQNQLFEWRDESNSLQMCPSDENSTLDGLASIICETYPVKFKQQEQQMDSYKKELETSGKNMEKEVISGSLDKAALMLNKKIDDILQQYHQASSSVRMQLQRQIDLHRENLKRVLFLQEELSLLSRSNSCELVKLRKACLGEDLIKLVHLQLERPHRTSVPQLPTAAIGANYSFEGWADEKSALSIYIPPEGGTGADSIDALIEDKSEVMLAKYVTELKKRADAETDADTKERLTKSLKLAEQQLDMALQRNIARLQVAQEIQQAKATLKVKQKENRERFKATVESMSTKKPLFSKAKENSGDGAFEAYRKVGSYTKSTSTTTTASEGSSFGFELNVSVYGVGGGGGASQAKMKEQSQGAETGSVKQFCFSFEWLKAELRSDVLTKMKPFFDTLDAQAKDRYVAVSAVFVQKEAFWDSSGEAASAFEEESKSQSNSFHAEASGGFGPVMVSAKYQQGSSSASAEATSAAAGKNEGTTITRGNLTLAFLLLKQVQAV